MNAETAIVIIVAIVAVTAFALGVKADAWGVEKCARLGIPYVVGDRVYKIERIQGGESK